MPPLKTVAKKVAKKAAKRTAGHHNDKHHEATDLRRAYEHMGRLEILRKFLKASTEDDVAELARLARKMIEAGRNKDAADLLRASEHLSFAHLTGEIASAGRVSIELEASIAEHFEELTRKADEHWSGELSGIVAALYKNSRKKALNSFKEGAYHQALEYARAVEALSHVKQTEPPKLDSGKRSLQIQKA